jgi:hypothetical protein
LRRVEEGQSRLRAGSRGCEREARRSPRARKKDTLAPLLHLGRKRKKFRFRYEAPGMETMLEDFRRAGLSPAPDAVAEFPEPGMFS